MASNLAVSLLRVRLLRVGRCSPFDHLRSGMNECHHSSCSVAAKRKLGFETLRAVAVLALPVVFGLSSKQQTEDERRRDC